MRTNFYDLPEDLPVPSDDGACDHLLGMAMPALKLRSTTNRVVDLAAASKVRSVFFFYPRTGRPDEPAPIGWDEIPGARGCTPQSCGFRDLAEDFKRVGAMVYGVSCQDTAFQQEFAARMHIPFEILSDEGYALTTALRLPTFTYNGMRLIKRLALVVEKGEIVKTFYPVFPPDRNAEDVLAYLSRN